MSGAGRAVARWALIASLATAALLPARAHAGGFFLPAHGTRGLGRAGAMLAGGDDPGGLWYNPATLGGQRGIGLLGDASLVLWDTSFERIDSGGNPRPSVDGATVPLPLPNIALSLPLGRKLWLGFGISTPLVPNAEWPRPSYGACDPADPKGCVDTAANDAPQRYSLISLDGTLLARLDLGLTYELLPGLYVGAALQNLFVSFYVLKAVSSYNGVASGGPEDPDFDSLNRMKMVDLFNPSGQIGVRYQPYPWVTLGAAVQLPFWIDAVGDVDVQLPASPVYEASTVEGQKAGMRVTFPTRVGIGVEVRPRPWLRVELDLQWEHWGGTGVDCGAGGGTCEMVVEPRDIYIIDLPGVPRYKVPAVSERLGFRDAYSLRLGVEAGVGQTGLTLRGGYGYERGAVEEAYHSVLANDANKHLFAVGAGYALGSWRLDLAYGLFYEPSLTVGYEATEARQTNPIKPKLAATVGGGRYTSALHVISAGIHKVF